MNKKKIYDKMLGGIESYQGHIYLACCIGVEYDYDIVSHFIKYYREMGVDKFLIILNTVVPNSERLKYVQKTLRCLGIEEVKVWREEYCPFQHTRYLMKILEENTIPEDWVLAIDIDEFHEYHCDLRKFITYLENNKYECTYGFFVDRLSKDGTLAEVTDEIDLFETFPIQKNMLEEVFCKEAFPQQKVMIHKSYVQLSVGQHGCFNEKEYKNFPEKLNVHHFKWRGNYVANQEERIINFRKKIKDNKSFRDIAFYHERPLYYYKKIGNFIVDEKKYRDFE